MARARIAREDRHEGRQEMRERQPAANEDPARRKTPAGKWEPNHCSTASDGPGEHAYCARGRKVHGKGRRISVEWCARGMRHAAENGVQPFTNLARVCLGRGPDRFLCGALQPAVLFCTGRASDLKHDRTLTDSQIWTNRNESRNPPMRPRFPEDAHAESLVSFRISVVGGRFGRV